MIKYFLLIILFSGCASANINKTDATLIDCINGYKKENPKMSMDLAYAYCSVKFDIMNRNKK
jgi:hypothetical protein